MLHMLQNAFPVNTLTVWNGLYTLSHRTEPSLIFSGDRPVHLQFSLTLRNSIHWACAIILTMPIHLLTYSYRRARTIKKNFYFKHSFSIAKKELQVVFYATCYYCVCLCLYIFFWFYVLLLFY